MPGSLPLRLPGRGWANGGRWQRGVLQGRAGLPGCSASMGAQGSRGQGARAAKNIADCKNIHEPFGGLRSRLSFVSHKYVLTQFLSGRSLLNNIFDRQARSSRAGMVKTGTRFPFMPQCQGKDKLFCVCHPFDIGTNRESRELFLVTYSLR